ncbi:hypothetical protein Bca52824_080076 [Brassica carinata]|nr:hypothetical protein Bca52824_080076 [Brassica carinata]
MYISFVLQIENDIFNNAELQQARELDQSTQVYSSLQPEMGSLLVRWEPLTSTLSLSLSATVSLPSHVSAAGSLYAKRGGPGSNNALGIKNSRNS